MPPSISRIRSATPPRDLEHLSNTLRAPVPDLAPSLCVVRWLGAQLEEGAAVLGILLGLAALGFAASRLAGGDAWASLLPLITATDALFTLLPVMRWMRLWLVDARRPTRRLDAASESLDPSILTTYALST